MQFLDSTVTGSAGIAGWYWDFGDGTTGTDQEPLHDYNANGSYTITFTVTDSSGNTSSSTKVLVVNTPTPIVTLPADTSVCEGTPVTLDAGPQPGCQYYWSTGETTQSIQVTQTGDYYVQVYNSMCAGFATITLLAKPQLSVNFASNQAGNCLPISVQLTDQSESCGSSIVYRRWNFDNGDTSSLQNPVFVYSSGGIHNVSLTERDNTGLELTTTIPVNINTNAIPVNLGNDTTICFGTPLMLDAGNPTDRFLWSTGDTTRTITVKNAGIYSVQVSSNGCIGWDTLVLNTVFPLAPAFGNNITSQCLPVQVNFSDSTQLLCGASPVSDWSWDFGDGTGSQQQNPSHVYNSAGDFTVKLTVHNSLGVADTISRPITIVTIGPDSISMPSSTVCLGYSAQLDAGNEGAQYRWTPSTPLTNDTIENPMAAPGVTTLFNVQVTKCGVTMRDSVMVYVDSAGSPVIRTDGTLLMSQPAVTYQWYKDGTPVPGATRQTYNATTAGYYQVEISNTKGCYGKSASYYFLPEGVEIPGSKMKVKVSPNPTTSNTIHVLFSKIPGQPVEVNLYDAYGRRMYTGTCRSNINTINCEQLHAGQYFVEVLTNGQRVVLPVQLF
jgi:PKD repeat protein